MQRADAVAELKRVFSVLKSDLDLVRAAVVADPSDCNKRNLVRTTFALIDGFSFHLRQVTLATLDGTELLTEGDRSILKEERFQLSSAGVPETKDNFQRTLPMILFSLRVYAKNHGTDFTPNTSNNGWNCLRQAVAIRDRVTHPRSLSDLQVTDQEGTFLADGVRWWSDALRDLLSACDTADERFRNRTAPDPS